MSGLDNDGLEEMEDWKSKFEALLKENAESKETRKLLEEQLEEKTNSLVDLEEKSGSLKKQLEVKNKMFYKLVDSVVDLESEFWHLTEKTARFDELVHKLEERVRCPVCLEVPTSGPMYSCANGHLVCAPCYQGSSSDCSLCRTRMNKTVSLLATTVIENIEHKCKFETDGCEEKTPLAGIEEHRKTCSLRPVDCPSHLCKEKVPFEHVVAHILNNCKHSFGKEDVRNSSIDQGFFFPANKLASTTYSVKPFKWNGKFFFLNMKIENEHHRNFYMQMLGTEEECKNYTVEISLKAKTGKCSAMFCDNPFPIEVSEEDVKAGGMIVTNAMKKKISFPEFDDQPDRLRFDLLLTFATVREAVRSQRVYTFEPQSIPRRQEGSIIPCHLPLWQL